MLRLILKMLSNNSKYILIYTGNSYISVSILQKLNSFWIFYQHFQKYQKYFT